MSHSNRIHLRTAFSSALIACALLATPAQADNGVLAPPAAQAPGDCDGNGIIDVLDPLLAGQAAVGAVTLNPAQRKACDVTNDGIVDTLDALWLSQMSVQTRDAPGGTAISVSPALKSPYVGVVPLAVRLASLERPLSRIHMSYSLDPSRDFFQPATIAAASAGHQKQPDALSDVPASATGDGVIFIYWDARADLGDEILVNRFQAELRLVVNQNMDGEWDDQARFGPFALGSAEPGVAVHSPAAGAALRGAVSIEYAVDNPHKEFVEIMIQASVDGGRSFLYSTKPEAGQLRLTPTTDSAAVASGPLATGIYRFDWAADLDLPANGQVYSVCLLITARRRIAVADLNLADPTYPDHVEHMEQRDTSAYSALFTYFCGQ